MLDKESAETGAALDCAGKGFCGKETGSSISVSVTAGIEIGLILGSDIITSGDSTAI